ncbi:hypothetical protein [Streptomyces camelliae]|uniref:Small hydrophilic protein n=1 Tax=Streptomyces camelliae TaxID=3004093 RepID=A0ABY7PF62_9ACTN|nr:hypothetical protein [Streptomyces sp. HUAS 2-6]WBO66903.1 hypothetical protein O1G22_30895 [Streptomyces sp. HUAS 2-6]
MAKNKKQDRKQQAPQTERSHQEAQHSSLEQQAEQRISHMSTPADVARKGRQKRFGHN